jgi:hypothetical protein
MRTASSQLWSTLLLFGLSAAVSCKDANDGNPMTADAASPPVDTAGSMAPADAVSPTANNQPPADKPADPAKPDETKPDDVAVTYAALERVASCDEAAELIRERTLANMNKEIDEHMKAPPLNWCARAAATGTASPASSPVPSQQQDSAGGESASATSMTNNQVAGVDEADFIKNDNKYMRCGSWRLGRQPTRTRSRT